MLKRPLPIHEVGIAIDGKPTYVIEVPTDQGREAAERRARVAVFWSTKIDLDRITICPAEVQE